ESSHQDEEAGYQGLKPNGPQGDFPGRIYFTQPGWKETVTSHGIVDPRSCNRHRRERAEYREQNKTLTRFCPSGPNTARAVTSATATSPEISTSGAAEK